MERNRKGKLFVRSEGYDGNDLMNMLLDVVHKIDKRVVSPRMQTMRGVEALNRALMAGNYVGRLNGKKR